MGGHVGVTDRLLFVDAAPGYMWEVSLDASMTGPKDGAGELLADVRMGMAKCSSAESARIAFERDEPWTALPGAPAELLP